jgi:hypothetical protein
MKCSRKFPEIELTIHNSTRWTFLKMWDQIKQQVKHLVNIPENVGPNENYIVLQSLPTNLNTHPKCHTIISRLWYFAIMIFSSSWPSLSNLKVAEPKSARSLWLEPPWKHIDLHCAKIKSPPGEAFAKLRHRWLKAISQMRRHLCKNLLRKNGHGN